MTDYLTRLEDATDCSGAAREDDELAVVTVGDLRSLLDEAERLRALLEEARKVVEPLVKFLSDAEYLQNIPDRGGWGVECALCMGELVEDGDKSALAAARSFLDKIKDTLQPDRGKR